MGRFIVFLVVFALLVLIALALVSSIRGYARKRTVDKLEEEVKELRQEKQDLSNLMITVLVTTVRHAQEGPMLARHIENILRSSNLVQTIEEKELGS